MNIHAYTGRKRFSHCIALWVCGVAVLVLSATFVAYEARGAFVDEALGASADVIAGLGLAAAGPSTPEETRAPQEATPRSLENAIKDIRVTGEKAESRTYYVKMMGRELLDLVKIAVGILLFIAVGLPLAIWLIARRGVLDFSNQSSNIATALLEVEERQAKLVNIFKDLQDEVELFHSSSTPDMRHLVEKARHYMDLNEKDLEKIDLPGAGRGNTLKQ